MTRFEMIDLATLRQDEDRLARAILEHHTAADVVVRDDVVETVDVPIERVLAILLAVKLMLAAVQAKDYGLTTTEFAQAAIEALRRADEAIIITGDVMGVA